jgi:pimeloyl-ACP methyl ester carboxylesterase
VWSVVAPVSRVLLVHGAWHGAWCWERVLEALRSRGFRPEAIDLPGHGDSVEPFGDLYGDGDAVRSRLDGFGEPTLLVGHSYGGMVITDAGDHDAVSALVYVCAFMPTAGQSAMDAFGIQGPQNAATSELLGCASFTDDGSATFLDGDGVVSALCEDCGPATQSWALERLGQQPTASLTQRPRRLAWTARPTTYVVCSKDRAIPAWQQQQMAENADRVVEMEAGHSPFLSKPDELATLLATAARPTT